MSLFEKSIQKVIEKIFNEDTWIHIGQVSFKILMIIIISGIVVRVARIAIYNIFKIRQISPLRTSHRREATIMRLLQNVLKYVVYFIAGMMILSNLNINVGPILAGAGILGLAVGFGAQSLVKDVITGFFIIFEDQFAVGDHVRIGQFEGEVEVIGLRTTKIKNWTGEVHIIPNGNILEVTNFSLHNSLAVIDISVAYEENIQEVEAILQDLLIELNDKYEDVVSPPQFLGVQSLSPSEVIIRVTAETLPMRHVFIAREFRREIKNCLDKHGIEIPYPRMVMYSRPEHENLSKKEVGAE
jgi:moderate conductance mechanosensitive channel